MGDVMIKGGSGKPDFSVTSILDEALMLLHVFLLILIMIKSFFVLKVILIWL